MKPLTAVIVEDSRLARNELKELLKAHKEIELLGEAPNVDEGFKLINETQPDLLFLDINMPEKNGFDLLELLDDVPITIFTTAFDEYAIKSFEYNAFDYLLKPINQKRFTSSIEKVFEKHSTSLPSESKSESAMSLDKQIFIKDGEKCWLVKIQDVFMFEIVGNYGHSGFLTLEPFERLNRGLVEGLPPEALLFDLERPSDLRS